MKLTTMTQVSVDGVMQGSGATEEDRKQGFERGGWAMGQGDDETMTFITQTYQHADAFLFGRRTYDIFAPYWGVMGRGDPGARSRPTWGQRWVATTQNVRTLWWCPRARGRGSETQRGCVLVLRILIIPGGSAPQRSCASVASGPELKSCPSGAVNRLAP